MSAFGLDKWIPVEWDDTTTENVIYLRKSLQEPTIIRKVTTTETGGTIQEAEGSWSDKTTLIYQ